MKLFTGFDSCIIGYSDVWDRTLLKKMPQER